VTSDPLTVSVRVVRQPFNTRPTIEIKVTGGTARENMDATRVAAKAAAAIVKASA